MVVKDRQFQFIDLNNLSYYDKIKTKSSFHDDENKQDSKNLIKNIDVNSKTEAPLTINVINEFKDRYVRMFNSSIEKIHVKSDFKKIKKHII